MFMCRALQIPKLGLTFFINIYIYIDRKKKQKYTFIWFTEEYGINICSLLSCSSYP